MMLLPLPVGCSVSSTALAPLMYAVSEGSPQPAPSSSTRRPRILGSTRRPLLSSRSSAAAACAMTSQRTREADQTTEPAQQPPENSGSISSAGNRRSSSIWRPKISTSASHDANTCCVSHTGHGTERRRGAACVAVKRAEASGPCTQHGRGARGLGGGGPFSLSQLSTRVAQARSSKFGADLAARCTAVYAASSAADTPPPMPC